MRIGWEWFVIDWNGGRVARERGDKKVRSPRFG